MFIPRRTIYLLLLWLPICSHAQTIKNPVPAQMQLLQTGQDTNRLKLLKGLGAHYLFRNGAEKRDLDSAFMYLYEAKSLAENLQAGKELKATMILLIKTQNETGDMPKLKNLCNSLIAQYQASGDADGEAGVWHWLGTNMPLEDSTNVYSLGNAARCYERAGNTAKQGEALKEIADIHLLQGKLDLSEQELLKVLEMYKSIGFAKLHFTYDLLTSVSILKGNLNRALVYGNEMIKSMEATGDSIVVAKTFFYRMARIHELLGQTEQSVKWYKRGYFKGPDANVVPVVRGLIKLGKAQEALDFVQDYVRKSPPANVSDQTYIANGLGECYEALKQYDLAEKYYREMVQGEREMNQHNQQSAMIHLTMGKFYVKMNRYREAEPYLRKILTMPGGIVSANRLKDTHLMLFKVDSAAGNYLSAIRHIQLHKYLNDSIFNETKSRQIEEFQVQYETEKKEKDIALLKNESDLQESRLKEAKLARNLTFGGGVLLLLILGLLYNRYRLKQRSNRRLELQQIEINNTNRSLQNLLEEKELLLREIHHRVKNNLQIVMSLLNTQSVYLENDAALSAIRDSQQRIHSISLIHKKLYQSNNIAQINMQVYIQELVDYLQDSYQTGKNLRFELDVAPIELDVQQAVPLGLILNEAISNAVKYAFPDQRAGTIAITMEHGEADQFRLSITDNGVGVPPGFDPRKSASLGMSLMRGLSKQLHGTFELKNEQGLTINIIFANDKSLLFAGKPQAAEMSV